ncbi:unnamed protein product [Adineta steineri]|uniref:Uncharacterized protein n=1 Tax=Adineta steineri TaxID=433720 RepID=A0A819TAY4_9BILA|nr:unnamed protein product [Adineta steineri]CAF4075372.1 unnamed protein product [Adineta steineri]
MGFLVDDAGEGLDGILKFENRSFDILALDYRKDQLVVTVMYTFKENDYEFIINMNQVPYRHIELIDKRNITSNLDNLIHSISSFRNETILHAPNRIRSNTFNYAFASQSAATSNPNIFLVQQASTSAATHVDAQTTSINEPSLCVPTDDNFIFDLHSSTATNLVGMLIIPPSPKIGDDK